MHDEISAEIFDALAGGSGFTQVLEAVCSGKDTQILFTDVNNQPVCAAGDNSKEIQAAAAMLTEQNLGQFEDMFRTSRPFTCFDGEKYMLCFPVFSDAGPSGMLYIRYSDKSKLQEATETAGILSKLWGYFTKESVAAYTQDYIRAGLTRELLLKCGSMDHSLYREAWNAAAKSKTGQTGYAAAAISGDSPKTLAEADKSVERYIPQAFHITQEGMLLVMLTGIALPRASADDPVFQRFSEFMDAFPQLQAGVSQVFSNLTARAGYRKQAMAALSLGGGRDSLSRTCFAEDIYADIMAFGAASSTGPGVLQSSDIVRLAECDRQGKTNMLGILEQYLGSGNRMTATAGRMYIDRSTLKDKLYRISRLLNCDLDDPGTAKNLMLGIKMYHIYELAHK